MAEIPGLKKEDLILYKFSPINEEYCLCNVLGSGSYGLVLLGIHKATKQFRAIKIMQKAGRDVRRILDEIDVLSKLTHPNILQMNEVFMDDVNLYVVAEYCQGGELFNVISKKGSFSESDACVIMKQVLSAVCYAHKNNIVHRDIKPENILLLSPSPSSSSFSDLTVKLIDWGCAKVLPPKERLHVLDGTPYYIAPEVLAGDYDEKCDVWSTGVVMYILLCGYPPFNGKKTEDIYKAIKKGNLKFPGKEWSVVSQEAKELISKMLEKDPKKRCSALEALDHEWFQKHMNKGTQGVNLAKSIFDNMKKFKKEKKLEQATVGFIVNQLINKEDHKDLMKQFQEWDTNGDGVLSREELIAGYVKTYGKADLDVIDNMIKGVDWDGNGVIDYNEFISCAMNKEKILSEDNLELCFKTFDSDGSGGIDADELMHIFHMSNATEEERELFEQLIKEVDTNGDGVIQYNEFKDFISKFLS